jgi:hypothetical protein
MNEPQENERKPRRKYAWSTVVGAVLLAGIVGFAAASALITSNLIAQPASVTTVVQTELTYFSLTSAGIGAYGSPSACSSAVGAPTQVVDGSSLTCSDYALIAPSPSDLSINLVFESSGSAPASTEVEVQATYSISGGSLVTLTETSYFETPAAPSLGSTVTTVFDLSPLTAGYPITVAGEVVVITQVA